MNMDFPWVINRSDWGSALLTTLVAIWAPGSQWELSLWDTNMKAQKLSQYRGKIVILNFWATWCTNCQEELPMLVEEQKRYARRGVIMIGASLDDATTVNKVRPIAKKHNLNFPIWIGATADHLQQFGLGQAIPATAFFDSKGDLVGRVIGVLRKDDLEYRIEWLLGNHQGSPPEPLVDNVDPK
jgi:thiol-disulfide isomerase/thioredoxin